MRAVNLLPKDSARGRGFGGQNLPALVGGGMGFLVVASLAGGYLSASSKVSAAQSALTAAQKQLASTPKPPATPTNTTPTVPQPTAAAAQEQPRLQAVSAILSQRIAYDRILREFSAVLPSDVWILSVAMTQPVNGATDGFTISGTTYSYDSVARMLARMNLIPDLTGVQLTSVSGGGKLVQFGIGASIKGAAAPPAPAATAPAPAPVVASTDTTSTDTTSGGSASAAGSGQ
jgi:Tfp pilus assembly protein PilN